MTLEGYGSLEKAREAIARVEELSREIDGPFRLVVDLHLFRGYETDVRKAWTEYIKANKGRMQFPIVAAGVQATIVKMAVNVLSTAAGVPIDIR